jgi:hypothetical protein
MEPSKRQNVINLSLRSMMKKNNTRKLLYTRCIIEKQQSSCESTAQYVSAVKFWERVRSMCEKDTIDIHPKPIIERTYKRLVLRPRQCHEQHQSRWGGAEACGATVWICSFGSKKLNKLTNGRIFVNMCHFLSVRI